MIYEKRLLKSYLEHELKRGKSILLLGARQTGKTTLVNNFFKTDISYSFVDIRQRLRYERSPEIFVAELTERISALDKIPIVFIDEIQKIPSLMDPLQYFIDKKAAQFILSGSSARKLKYGSNVNLLPGRVTVLNMTPFSYKEIEHKNIKLDNLLLYGSLPAVINTNNEHDKETELTSYVTSYLENEIRAEAIVRNLGDFARFLQVAAAESGKQLNFSKLSQEIGIADTTIKNYFQILEDCLIAYRLDPITKSTTNRKLIKSCRYIFFDLGVRRVSANEANKLSDRQLGDIFEQFIGLELINYSKLKNNNIKIKYWRDSAGPEVDYVIDGGCDYMPIEVKWTDRPSNSDARHLFKFIKEYSVDIGYIVCRTPYKYKISKEPTIIALPWQEVTTIF